MCFIFNIDNICNWRSSIRYNDESEYDLGMVIAYFIKKDESIFDDLFFSSIAACIIMIFVDVNFSTLTGYSLLKESRELMEFIPSILDSYKDLIFYLSIFSFDYQYGYIFIIQSINILSATLDITWLFTGLEDFKKTVTRNLFMKILCILGVFILVKTRNDLNIYILLMALMNFWEIL